MRRHPEDQRHVVRPSERRERGVDDIRVWIRHEYTKRRPIHPIAGFDFAEHERRDRAILSDLGTGETVDLGSELRSDRVVADATQRERDGHTYLGSHVARSRSDPGEIRSEPGHAERPNARGAHAG